MSVAQLLVPVARASFGGQIEQIPERLERADVTWLLVAVRRGIEQLLAPEMADCVRVAMVHIEHWALDFLVGFCEVVAVVCVALRGQEA